MQSLKLFHYWRSSCSWRVRLALAHKEIPVDYEHINILKDETSGAKHLARNPIGHVPALDVPGVGLLSESTAILEWLEEAYPKKPLLPKDAFLRARTRQLVQYINSGIQPLQNRVVLIHLSPDQGKRDEWAKYWIHRGLLAFEKALAQTAGTYCVGSELTHADFCLVPQFYNAARFNMDLTAYPTAHKIHQSLVKLDAYTKTHPDVFEPRPH